MIVMLGGGFILGDTVIFGWMRLQNIGIKGVDATVINKGCDEDVYENDGRQWNGFSWAYFVGLIITTLLLSVLIAIVVWMGSLLIMTSLVLILPDFIIDRLLGHEYKKKNKDKHHN